MRAPISIVIPTLDAAGQLPATLASLSEGLDAGLVRELVISDGGSCDDTLGIAARAGAVTIAGAPGRGGQLRRGAEAAGGAWLLFLHADTRLKAGWAEAVARHVAREERAAWFRLAFRAAGWRPRLVAGWANLRAGAGLPYGDQGLLIPRGLYREVGGFPDIALMEDVAMARRLRGRLKGLDAVACTDAGRYERNGWMRQGAGNLWRLMRYLLGADPARLAAGYERPGRDGAARDAAR